MPKPSLAPAMRAIVFFGLMGAAVSGLTLGARLQTPADRSSTTVALARGVTDPAGERRVADRADRPHGLVERIVALLSQPVPERNG